MNPVEDERPHQHPAQHDPDQPREPEALGDHGSGEQHDGGHEERPFGGHRRELDGQRHAVSLNAATDGLRAQKISGHHGARSAANIASARAAAPRRSSSTLPPRTRPREREPSEVRAAEGAHVAGEAAAPDVVRFARPRASASVPRSTGRTRRSRRRRRRRPTRSSRAESAAPTSTSRTQSPSPTWAACSSASRAATRAGGRPAGATRSIRAAQSMSRR